MEAALGDGGKAPLDSGSKLKATNYLRGKAKKQKQELSGMRQSWQTHLNLSRAKKLEKAVNLMCT